MSIGRLLDALRYFRGDAVALSERDGSQILLEAAQSLAEHPSLSAVGTIILEQARDPTVDQGMKGIFRGKTAGEAWCFLRTMFRNKLIEILRAQRKRHVLSPHDPVAAGA
jgi:hypothetical protein